MSDDRIYIKEILDNGSEEAFRHLVNKYKRQVFTIAYRMVKNREEAEEVSQDVFLKCYKNLIQLKDLEKFPNWLMKIAFTKSIEHTRRKKRKVDSIEEHHNFKSNEEESPYNVLKDKSRNAMIHHAISLLKPEEAAIITLYYLNEKAIVEISEITGLGQSNVKVKLFRSRDKLKQILSRLLNKDIKDIL